MKQQRRYLELAGLLIASLALWWRPLADVGILAWNHEAYTHILIVPFLTVAFVHFEANHTSLNVASPRWPGIILLAFSALLYVISLGKTGGLRSDDILALSMISFLCWAAGSVFATLGLKAFRSLLFPLCLMLLMVPFPERLLVPVTDFLQRQSAFIAAILFRISQTPVVREGALLSIPGLNISVARECSSIRSSMMLIVATLVLVEVFLEEWWKRAIVILAALPLSIVKNGVRIFTIAELGTRVDSSFLTGRLHHQGGVVFFAMALATVWALVRSLAKRQYHKRCDLAPPEGTQCSKQSFSLERINP